MTSTPELPAAVVYITSSFPFGTAETWTLGEMKALTAAGARVLLVPRSAGTKAELACTAELLPLTVCAPLLSLKTAAATVRACCLKPGLVFGALGLAWRKATGIGDFLRSVAVIPKALHLAEMLQGQNVAHVHAYSTTTVALMAAVLARSLEVPVSFTLHSNSIVRREYRRMFEAMLKEAVFARLVARDGVAPLAGLVEGKYRSKIRAIHLGVPCEDAYAGPVPAAGPSPANDPFLIVTPAALTARKGHVYAIAAARILLDSGFTSFQWLCFGEGPLREELVLLARTQGLERHVVFPGYVRNELLLERFRLRQCDSVVLPSISIPPCEGIPHSLIQAMSYGIAVIATDCGSTSELLAGGAGILVPERDASALAAAILSVARNQDLRRSLCSRARERIADEFNEKTTAAQLMEAFCLPRSASR